MMEFFIDMGDDHGDKFHQTVWFIYDIFISIMLFELMLISKSNL